MDKRIPGIRLILPGILMILIIVPNPLAAQFEQKLSLNISAGYFNTIGWTGWQDEWSQGSDYYEPTLMPNFKGGPAVYAGIQYNFNRHFSIEFQLGYSLAPGWFYDASDPSDPDAEPVNSLYYEIYADTVNWEVLASGENYMDMTNVHMGIVPRYYFGPAKRFNPFIFAGISLNYTSTYFEDLEYKAYQSLGITVDENGGPVEPSVLNYWFDDQVGLGLMAGAGIEYARNDSWGLFATASYHFIPLKDGSFQLEAIYGDYHDISIQVGARISILKSKEL
ncbi:MAG: outer membrane beta-barrel protein [Bacteroidota bacterium]